MFTLSRAYSIAPAFPHRYGGTYAVLYSVSLETSIEERRPPVYQESQASSCLASSTKQEDVDGILECWKFLTLQILAIALCCPIYLVKMVLKSVPYATRIEAIPSVCARARARAALFSNRAETAEIPCGTFGHA